MESTSLDRLEILKDRVILTVKEYETLLESMENAFKNSNTKQIEELQYLETQMSKSLFQRVRIFKSYLEILKKNHITITDPETDVYNSLDVLYKKIETFKEDLSQEKIKLSKEMSQVKKIIRPFGKLREETARRIDIIT